MIELSYYACLRRKEDGYLEKKRFPTREEAREYLAKTYDPNIHDQMWTE